MPTSAAPAPWRPTTRRMPAETAAANPAWFGPAAPRVKGGIDLVGDGYNADPDAATYQPIPHPDPNPLDCNGRARLARRRHGGGSGVLANGTTYTRRVQRDDDLRQQLDRRAGRCAQGRPLRGPRVRLRRLDRRHGRCDRMGGRQRHGRDQHVARLVVRHERRSVGGRHDERGEGRRRRRHVGRQQRRRASTSPARPARPTARSRPPRTIRCSSFPASASTRRLDRSGLSLHGDQRQRRHAVLGRPLVVLTDDPATTADIPRIRSVRPTSRSGCIPARTRSTASSPAAADRGRRSAAPARAWPRRSSPSRPAPPRR